MGTACTRSVGGLIDGGGNGAGGSWSGSKSGRASVMARLPYPYAAPPGVRFHADRASSRRASTLSGDAARWRRYDTLHETVQPPELRNSSPPIGFTCASNQIFWFGKSGVCAMMWTTAYSLLRIFF